MESDQNPTKTDRALPSLQLIAKAYKPLRSITEFYKTIDTSGSLHKTTESHIYLIFYICWQRFTIIHKRPQICK